MSRNFDQDLHKRYLTTLLSAVVRLLSGKVVFKGGTCALLFYKLPRFSFDLDFDILEPLTKEEVASLRSILLREGRLVDWHDKHFTLLGVLDYGKDRPNIKIELNKRLWENNVHKTVWFLGLPLQIADETTILTNKLVALTDRKTPVARDLYDIWFFLQMGFVVNADLVRERTGKDSQVYFKETIAFIKKTFTARNVLQGLGETLGEEQKTWAKQRLIAETVSELERRMGADSG